MSRTTLYQDDCFGIKGNWWLPGSDHKVAGEVTYSEEDISLSLYGGLSDALVESLFSARPEQAEYALIYGESEDNSPITLLNAFYTKWKPNITSLAVRPGARVSLRSSQLHCGVLFEGIHLPTESETFSKCQLAIPYFDVWLGKSPFTFDMEDPLRSVRLEYIHPATEDFDVTASRCRVRFLHAVTPPGLPFGPSPAITHQAYLEIEPYEPQSFGQLMECWAEVVDLFSVLYGGPLLSKRVLLYPSSHGQEPVSVFFPRHKVTLKSYDVREFLIHYEKIKPLFQAVLSEWLNATANLKRARRMLLSSERRPSKFIELRFLPLAHAAEVLSNEAGHTTVIAPAEFRKIRDTMLASLQEDVPRELVESIKNSLQWANGRSLRDKLRSLLKELHDDTVRLFSVDKEQFIAGVVSTRNHYTHYSTSDGKKYLQEESLHWCIQKLALMIRIVLLFRAGVPEQDVRSAIRSHIGLGQERSVWRDVTEVGSEPSGLGIE